MRNRIRYAAVFFIAFAMCLLPLTGIASEENLELYARSAVLMDGDSGRILYGKEADAEMPMASTTKIMTCILALENAKQDTVCTVSGTASAQPQVKLGMKKGDAFRLGDLLYSLMLESHNDTAVCIAETVGGSVEGFAAMMNEKAASIGCTSTYYITPNGLDAQDETGVHHTTARELALVMRYCLTQSPKREEFLEITRAATHTFSNLEGTRSYGCTNHNAFLSLMQGALSGKTGFTGDAGYCYVGALKRDGKLFIVSLLACGWPNNKGYKWVDTKKLMNYGLENFEQKNITGSIPGTKPMQIENGQCTEVETAVDGFEEKWMLLKDTEQVRVSVEMEEKMQAPVARGQEVGRVRYYVGDTEYASFPVIAKEEALEIDFLFCLDRIWREFLP